MPFDLQYIGTASEFEAALKGLLKTFNDIDLLGLVGHATEVALKKAVSNLEDDVSDAVNTAGKKIADAANSVEKAAKGAVNSAGKAINSAGKALANATSSAVNGAEKAISGIFLARGERKRNNLLERSVVSKPFDLGHLSATDVEKIASACVHPTFLDFRIIVPTMLTILLWLACAAGI